MTIERFQTGSTIAVEAFIKDASENALTGLTDIVYVLRRISDDYFLDFSDDTFKASGWTTKSQTMTEIDATEAPGEYQHSLDTSSFVNPASDDSYSVRVYQSTLPNAKNVPQFLDFILGQYVDDIDAAITTRATPTEVKTQADQALVDYDPPTATELAATEVAIRGSDGDDLKAISDQIDGLPAATDVVLTAAHGVGPWQGTGTPADIADAVWDEVFADHESANTMGLVMKMLRALVTAKMEQDPSANEWIISDPDTGDPWIEFDTVNAAGDPASVNVYKRTPK